jgi:hypothetical protein
MTLRKKFKDVLINPIWQMTMIDKQMQITDEFAIGFAEWILDWPEDWHRIEELLEIYKKEKGL